VAMLVPVAALAGEVWWGWIATATGVPFAYRLLREILGGTEGRALNPVLKQTARFNLIFGVAWAVGLAFS
jgi:1,4-dihydroxy-2-naphthoate polyprenyltransferase